MLAFALFLLVGSAHAGIISGGNSVDGVSASSAAATYVNKAGDTMTGRLTAPDATLTYGLTAATAAFLSGITASSGTFSGGSGGGLLVGDGGVAVTNTNYDGVAVSITQSNSGDAALRLRQSVSDSTYALQINNAADTVVNHGLYGSGNAFHLGTLGIGTASPAFKLDILGGVFRSSTTSAENAYIYLPSANGIVYASVHADGNRASPLFCIQGRAAGAAKDTCWQQSGSATGFWGFQLGGSYQLSINNANGFMEIGNLAAPDEKLHVRNGNAKADYGFIGSTTTLSGATPVTASTWTATYTGGSAYVCISNAGVMFVSEAACP